MTNMSKHSVTYVPGKFADRFAEVNGDDLLQFRTRDDQPAYAFYNPDRESGEYDIYILRPESTDMATEWID